MVLFPEMRYWLVLLDIQKARFQEVLEGTAIVKGEKTKAFIRSHSEGKKEFGNETAIDRHLDEGPDSPCQCFTNDLHKLQGNYF